MDLGLVLAIGIFGSTMVTIALMAYFALRPETPGSHCPYCDKSVKLGATVCPRCRRPISVESRGPNSNG